MFQNFIQEQVDILSETLQRSIAIDDVDINLVAASKHFGDADTIRIKAMLDRTLDREAIDHLYSFGILEGTADKYYTGPCEELGIRERYCYPIRSDNALLGFLWLLDKVSDSEHAIAIQNAKEFAVPMLGLKMARQKEFLDQESMALDLISDNTHRVSRAVFQLTRQGKASVTEEYLVLCLVLESHNSYGVERDFRLLSRWLSNTPLNETETASSFIYPHLIRHPSELLVIMPKRFLSSAYIDFIVSLTLYSKIKIGIGNSADIMHLYDSYIQASTIGHILQILPHSQATSTWDELGIYGHLLTYLLDHKNGMACMPFTPKIQSLHHSDPDLVETLEAFLDNAGNIGKTAQEINIHRSTLYYRLSKIEEITATKLNLGADRLLLHLEVKLWRLALQMHILK